jgi:hypothetical protein
VRFMLIVLQSRNCDNCHKFPEPEKFPPRAQRAPGMIAYQPNEKKPRFSTG